MRPPLGIVPLVRGLTVCGVLTIVAPLAAQDVGPQLPPSPFNQGAFRFAAGVRQALRQFWQASVDARQERVACIGGHQRDGIAYITRVEPLVVSPAGSRSIAAGESLRRCAPPDWLGTVHTHVATFAGHPYVTFSANDRQVMFLWRRTWHIDGVFCVLYDGEKAHCEGESGVSGDPVYAYPRGNRTESSGQ
ncbi:MAG: hypothetical protein ACREMF_11780 [Gemmatimonadales bacterium]